MRKLSLKRFTNHIFLKRVGRDLLDQFLERFPDVKEQALSQSGLDFYSALAALFMRAERLPAALVEELLTIEEMSTPDGLSRLQRAPEWPWLQERLRADSTAEDIAMQVWLMAPEVVASAHAVLRLRRLTSFEHAAARVTGGTCPVAGPPDHLTIVNLTVALDDWFRRHQRGLETAHVDVHTIAGDTWFLIRHGDVCKRVAKVDRQRTDILHLRPRRDDVVVYSHRLNELMVNARSKAERDLYIREFGRHLHGDPDYFSERRPFTLEPLRELGRDALDADGLEGIRHIRLCKLALRLENSNNETIIREADDLFYCPAVVPFQRGPIPHHGALERALFEIQFTGSPKPHPVEIRLPNILKMSRRCDPEAVQNWLCRRGFRRVCDTAAQVAYIEE